MRGAHLGPVVFVTVSVTLIALRVVAQERQSPDAPRPIEAGTSLWAEELTSMEVRDAIREGNTTIIIGTGGVEQNGPYVVGGKHNYVLQTVLPYIAREIGHALIAPVVKFVPEGDIEPLPTGHMQYAGTISLEQATFEALLTDICRSYKAHGFIDIVLLGDSGGNQAGMAKVADELNSRWSGERARVHYLREYYEQDKWSYGYLKSLGITQVDRTPPAGQPGDRPADWRNGIHDDFYYEAQIAVQDPQLIRMHQRIKAQLFSLHGVQLAPVSRTIEIGRQLAEYRAGITAKAFEASRQRLRTSQAVNSP
jgi:creatinine amidohydrolase